MKNLIVFLVACLSAISAMGQNGRRVIVEQKYALKNAKLLDSSEINIAIPKDYKGRQVINDITYSIKPKFIYKVGEVSYAQFALDKRDLQKTDSIIILIDMTISPYDLGVAKVSPEVKKLSKRKRKEYLKTNGFYELPEFDEIAVYGENKETDNLNLVSDIQGFVEKTISYQSFFGKDLGPKYALQNGKGDCTEYSDLMIALCRVNNLPARRVSGYTVKRESNDALSKIFKFGSHAWVEVYFEGMGWVPFDPTHSDDSRSTSFEHLQTKYVYYGYDENSKITDFWKYWGPGQFQVKRKTFVRDFDQVPGT